ncbi:MAG: aldolase/citrate lyase family protein [Dehalococcoidia bacterium]|nr:aldolase/citrate lyase family protein [Dehalococcoidia bacterium]
MRENMIQTRLGEGRAAVGASLNVYSPHLVELIGAIGFDWVFIDCEHGSMSEPEAESMMRAAETYGIAPVVRVPANEPQLILRMLDAGAMGIVVPHVDNVDDARRAAAAAKYPPLGQRGSNYGTGRNNQYGAGTSSALEYYDQSNERTILFALIESQDGVDNIDEILSVDGIDATWLGPADMALSMGMPEQRVVDEALDMVVTKTVAAGKIAAATHPAPEVVDKIGHFHALGARVLAVSAFALLKQSAGPWHDTVRALDS